jgi:hypothetical protein
LVILQRLQNNLELDLKVPTSSSLISQLLRYDVLTVSSFLRRPLELLAPSLDLPKRHLQILNLLLGVLQVVVKLLLTVAKAYETSQLAYHKTTSLMQEQDYQREDSTHQWIHY